MEPTLPGGAGERSGATLPLGLPSDSPSLRRLRRFALHAPARGRYELRGEIARGGMGTVFALWDADLRRHVAMKVVGTVAPEGERVALDERVVRRFLDEVHVTAQLDHPGIVPVYEAGVDEAGRPFFVMPLVRGRALDEILRRDAAGDESWTRTRALGVLLKVCETVAFAHERGVVHRDLKPSNVMVGRFGEVYVMDWGLAKLRAHARREESRAPGPPVDAPFDAARTQDGDVVGTPAYMAPEQAAGEVDAVGPLSDVYSLGAILYHLLAGRMPYDGTSLASDPRAPKRRVDWILLGPPPPLRELDPHLPPDLLAICEKAMARAPSERYESALALADDLRAFLEGHVVRAYRTGVVAEVRKWTVRNRLASAALVALAALALASATGFVVQQRGKVEAIAAERNEARGQSYTANLRAAEASLDVLRTREAKRRLAAAPQELRGWEWEHLARRVDARELILAHGAEVRAVALAPDGERLATADAEGIVRVWAGTREVARHACGVELLALAQDAQRLVAGAADGTVHVLGADATPRAVLAGHAGPVRALALGPDGLVVSGAHDGTVRAWDASGASRVVATRARPIEAVALAPDGRTLATGAGVEVATWDLATGALVRAFVGHERSLRALDFDASGERLVSGAVDGTARVWDVASGAALAVLRGHGAAVDAACFEESGARVVTGSVDGTLRAWDAASGHALFQLQGHDGPVTSLALAAGGTRIASGSADGTAALWSARPPGSARAAIDGEDNWVEAIAFVPGAERLASVSSRDALLRVWDARSLAPLGAHALEAPASCLAVTPGGARAALALAPGGVALVELESGALVRTLATDAPACALAVDPAGLALAAGDGSGLLRVWDERGAVRFEEAGAARVDGVAWSPDGARVATASWDGRVRVHDARTGAELAAWRAHDDMASAVAWHPHEATLATGARDGAIRVWSAASGALVRELVGHDGPVWALAYDPSGRRLASGSFDHAVRVWDAASGEALLALHDNASRVHAVAWSDDGARLASGARDGTVLVWEGGATLVR